MKFKINILIFFFLLIGASLNGQNQDRPNVLFIIVDDLNDYVGSLNGHKLTKTPNIDKLSSSAINFKNAHTNVPVCQPSRNSLFTGIYPIGLKILDGLHISNKLFSRINQLL